MFREVPFFAKKNELRQKRPLQSTQFEMESGLFTCYPSESGVTLPRHRIAWTGATTTHLHSRPTTFVLQFHHHVSAAATEEAISTCTLTATSGRHRARAKSDSQLTDYGAARTKSQDGVYSDIVPTPNTKTHRIPFTRLRHMTYGSFSAQNPTPLHANS